MAAATMASSPPPLTITAAILALIALIALALALPWTRIEQRGGGRAVTRLIHQRHDHHHSCHLCLHSQNDGIKEDGRGNRHSRNTDIHGQEEVGHHNPIGVEQQKQKQKQGQKK
jgi:hypothetical protein